MTWEWCKISGLLPMISRPHYRYVMFVSNCKVRLPRELYQDAMGISTTNYLLGFIMYFSYLGPDKILRRPKMGPRQLSRVPANLSYVTCFCNPTTLRNEHCSFTNTRWLLTKVLAKRWLHQIWISCQIFDCAEMECFHINWTLYLTPVTLFHMNGVVEFPSQPLIDKVTNQPT